MTSALNKRQQARNERALQDLIKSVPGNDKCADCAARNPGWASWSLGIFLCMRCATLHRKLGTHISKVKSLSMDSWNNDQVDNMKKIGNVNSNRTFNPNNTRPSIPIDVDEVDGAMERFVRQKYEHRAFSTDTRLGTRHNTGSTSSMEDRPPPLPPKPRKHFNFGLRASSSTFPMSKPDTVSPPVSPGLSGFSQESPPRVNKASRVFGHSVRGNADDSFETKLATLREMGFQDEKRNVTVLKGLNGNLDKSVETLIRLGEGSKSDRVPSRAGTPAASTSDNVNGISINRSRPAAGPSGQSLNPFDALDSQQPAPQQPLPSLQTQGLSASGPTANAYNPFLQPSQPAYSAHPGLEQSFQNLQLAQPPPQQQLFPHHTGGYGSQTAQQTLNPFFQSMTPPPMPQIPPQYTSLVQQSQSNGQPLSAQPTGSGNPFLRTSRSQTFTPNNPFGAQAGTPTFGQTVQSPQAQMQPQHTQLQSVPEQQSFGMTSPPAFQPMHQSYQQQQYQSPDPYQQQQQGQTPTQYQQQQGQNPMQYQQQQGQAPTQYQQQQGQAPTQYQQQQSQTPTQYQHDQNGNPYQQQQPGQMQNPYQQQPQYYQPARQDKSSILALYGQTWQSPAPQHDAAAADASAPRRSVTMPVSPAATQPGSHNPFGQAVPQPVAGGASARHVSHESVDFAGLMGGRHSPDAFAGLSAKWAR